MKYLVFLALVALMPFIEGKEEDMSDPKPEMRNGMRAIRHKKYTYFTDLRTWDEAAVACNVNGQHLAVIDSQEEEWELALMFDRYGFPRNSPSEEAYIGFHDRNVNGVFQTVMGKDLLDQYFSWNKGEPNNLDGEEHCGGVFQNGKLCDDGCYRTLPFVCEDYTDECF